jgi:sugar lactone lactonase YvrE
MDSNENSPRPDGSGEAGPARVSKRLLPVASVVGAFGVFAAAVLRPGAAPPAAPAAGAPGPAPDPQPPAPLPQQYTRSAVVVGPGMPGEFRRSLSGLALGPAGAVYALGDDEVRVFEAGGRLARTWRAPGEASCLSVAPDGRVAVGSPGGVDLYSGTGDHVGRIAAGTREKPADVTAVRLVRDSLLVADAATRVIRRYDLRGNELGVIGAQNKTGGFMLPNRNLDFDIDAEGVIYAADTGRHQVTSWTLDGTMVGSFGKFGMARPEDFVGCCNPVNVAVAPDGSLVTAEKAVARVKVFSRDRRLLAVIGPEHFDPMCRHIHIAVDSTGRIVAADPERRTIASFERS